MEDFLTVTAETAPTPETPTASSKKSDPNIWKPSIKNDDKEYQAKVRILPRGVNGLKNKLYPSVMVLTHHLADKKTKLFTSVKCPKTADINAYCPICEAAWGIYNAGKSTNNKDLMDLGKSRLPVETHLINVYFRDDITKPENNGTVKIWEHTKKMNTTLFAPTKEEKSDKKKLKKTEVFYPYAPKNGRDFDIIVTENPENGYPAYDYNGWVENVNSDLADTNEEIMGILDKCFDLTKYVTEIPSNEELARVYTDFCTRLEEKQRASAGSYSPASGAGSSAPAPKNVSTGSAQDFLGESKPKATPAPAPASYEEEPVIGDDSDDLPF